ncbi:MAG: tetratricopeptide repeat protein [Candidatus Lokiarchaeota archaeon]|nr:tetratricopeptide repeat protein [Candidatus Lokiarchaeota archaeon]
MKNSKTTKILLEEVRRLKSQEKYEEALKILEDLHENYPNSEEIKKILIDTLFDYGGYLNDYYTMEFEKAKQSFERITILSPKNYRAHYNLGIAYFNLGQMDNAKNSFEKALTIKPDYKYCLYNLGLIYEDLEQYEEALNYYEQALEIDSNFTYAITARSQVRQKLDDLKHKNMSN